MKFRTGSHLADVIFVLIGWGVMHLWGSNFAIVHWLSRSPLTQGCTTACLWFKKKD